MKPMATQRGSSCRVSGSISAVSQSKASMAAKSTPCLTRLACRFVSSHSNRAPTISPYCSYNMGCGSTQLPNTRSTVRRHSNTAVSSSPDRTLSSSAPVRAGPLCPMAMPTDIDFADGRFPQCTSFSPGRPEIHDYFHSLRIPPTPTLYDHLLLALRKKDVVATFNWDPLLLQAAKRCIEGGEGRERSWRNEPGRDHRHSGRNGAQILLA